MNTKKEKDEERVMLIDLRGRWHTLSLIIICTYPRDVT